MPQKTETKKHRITIRLNDNLMESIQNKSKNSNQPVSTVIRNAIENELYGATTPSTQKKFPTPPLAGRLKACHYFKETEQCALSHQFLH